MNDLDAAIERLERLSVGQTRRAAREIAAYLAQYPEFPFRDGLGLKQLTSMIQRIPADDRPGMIDAVQELAEHFERANHVRSTGSAQFLKVDFNLDLVRIPEWPAQECCEIIGDYVIRKVCRTRDGHLYKDSVDCAWNEGLVTLSETAPSAEGWGELAEVRPMSPVEFEAVWNEAPFLPYEGDKGWELVDTTQSTDARFDSVVGVWMPTARSGELVEFTLNGMVLWSEPDLPVKFYRYAVDGNDVLLHGTSGTTPVKFALLADMLVDDAGRRYIRE